MTSAEAQPGATCSRVALTGATGYVGGRLAPMLLDEGYRLRCLVREPRKLAQRPWCQHNAVEVVHSDLSDVDALAEQLQGCEVAYYLVHSMVAVGSEYADRDQTLAKNFAEASARAGVKRIVYLGGLGDADDSLSEHLRSRRDVESLLASTGVPVTTLRAAIIIGSGSASFEILRYLVARLPVMITPRWVATECQPVAIRDVLYWLLASLKSEQTVGRVLEVGGPEVLTYRELMQLTAEEMGLRRRTIVTVPLLTPRLSSAWISLVTPVTYKLARPLADGLSNRVVVGEHSVQKVLPHRALTAREAIRQALSRTEQGAVETSWSAAGTIPGDPEWAGGRVYTDERSIDIKANPEEVFAAVCRIGGGHGWYAGDVLWKIRGWMDQLVGGPGLRRGRRHPESIEFGEALDFWRVVGLERGKSLLLHAEMKLPGTARLEFNLDPIPVADQTRLTMTARYRPKGLLGIAYWYAVVPLHNLVFGGMLRGIQETAEALRHTENIANAADAQATTSVSSYGRARLWLGISAVGSVVVLSALALAYGLPAMLQARFDGSTTGTLMGLATFVGLYTLIQLPFDLAGGYLLPKQHGRSHDPLSAFLTKLARGVLVQAGVLVFAAALITLAGAVGGLLGVLLAGTLLVVSLLWARAPLAALAAPMRLTPSEPESIHQWDSLRVLLAETEDEGFTGGITGLLRPTSHILPLKWLHVLGEKGFEMTLLRRTLAIQTHGWWRGRAIAVLFTLIGMALAAWLTGSERLGSLEGTVAISLWFTLWSFLGLLVLPTLSRRAVVDIDLRLRKAGYTPEEIDRTARLLDGLQDDEPERPTIVETIFHPIPSVSNRMSGPRSHGAAGAWDVARTSVFLSAAGVGLLGRAVHCNCGRPSLWVFLPTD